jgi:methionyl-tRNA formyltransferase
MTADSQNPTSDQASQVETNQAQAEYPTMTVAVAGSTQRTVQTVQSLWPGKSEPDKIEPNKSEPSKDEVKANSQNKGGNPKGSFHVTFKLNWVLTPTPKPQGRSGQLKPTPVQTWAQSLPSKPRLIQVGRDGITQKIKKQILTASQPKSSLPDFLLVIDFGYLIPDWLLTLPRQATLNVHPSLLPRWRGSSPGPFTLLANDQQAGVSIIKLTSQLDQGPIAYQEKFALDSTWTSSEYYQAAFTKAAQVLPKVLMTYGQTSHKDQGGAKSQDPTLQPQPKKSPTPMARRLQKQDAFLPWSVLAAMMQGWGRTKGQNEQNKQLCAKSESVKSKQGAATIAKSESKKNKSEHTGFLKNLIEELPANSVLCYFLQHTKHKNWPQLIARATRAFKPWPLLWTKIPTKKGLRRMQILQVAVEAPTGKKRQPQLKLKKVKIAGQQEAQWNQVKNIYED